MATRRANVPESGFETHVVSLAEQFEHYDSLPAALRELFDAAPVVLDARDFTTILQQRGQSAALLLIEGELCRQFPGWSPLRRLRQSRHAK